MQHSSEYTGNPLPMVEHVLEDELRRLIVDRWNAGEELKHTHTPSAHIGTATNLDLDAATRCNPYTTTSQHLCTTTNRDPCTTTKRDPCETTKRDSQVRCEDDRPARLRLQQWQCCVASRYEIIKAVT